MHNPSLIYILRNRELDEMYITLFLKSFAIGLIYLFVPGLLWNLGYSLNTIIYFFVTFFAAHFIGFPIFAGIASKKGIKHSMLPYPFLYIITYILLFLLGTIPIPLELIAFVFGMAASSFWVNFHIDFSKFSDRHHRGVEVGLVKFINVFTVTIPPLLGGVVITLFGFDALFILSGILLLGSIIPLYLSKEVFVKHKFSIHYIKEIKDENFFLVTTGRGLRQGLGLFMWPLFIFIIVGSFISLGEIATVAGIIVAVLSLFIGKVTDSKERFKLSRAGTLIHAASWWLRGFSLTTIGVFLFNILDKITALTMTTPYESVFYDKTNKKKENRTGFIVLTEWYLNAGRIIILLLFLLMPGTIVERFIGVFILTGFASLIHTKLRK